MSTCERLAAAASHLASNRLSEAAEQIEAALRSEPADPAARAIEGVLHDVSGRTELAVASYRATLFLDPALFQVRLFLADALRRLGFVERAQHEYHEALRDPRRPQSPRAGGAHRRAPPDRRAGAPPRPSGPAAIMSAAAPRSRPA